MPRIKCLLILAIFLIWRGSTSIGQQVIVNPSPTLSDRYPKKFGNLRMSSNLVRIGRIANSESKTDTLFVYNEGSKSIHLAPGRIPAHIQFTLGTDQLKGRSASWIAIAYDAAKKHDFGYVYDRFELVTSDSLMPKKTISVTALITETFKPLSAEDSTVMQKARWPEQTFHFGVVKKGIKLSHDFAVWNDGKYPLIIRKATARCACLQVSSVPDTIAAGGRGMIRIEYNSANRKGDELHRIEVIVNDPFKPEVFLELKGEVTD